MYISINWIKSLLELNNFSDYLNKTDETNKTYSLRNLLKYYGFNIDQLTLTGFEVEDIYTTTFLDEKDIIVEIDTTPNRADVSNLIGFTREICSLMKFSLITKPYFLNEIELKNNKLIRKADKEQKVIKPNPEYSSCLMGLVNNIKVTDSPKWLQKRLLSTEINPINNFVDISNYIMEEWGQPLHMYDFDKIVHITKSKNFKIGIRYAIAGETFVGLNDEKYTLNEKNLIITANDYPIALAGILGGKETCVDKNTQNVLLECFVFNAKKIRQSSRSLGLQTKASSVYTKGVSPEITQIAFQRALKLIELSSQNSNVFKIKLAPQIKNSKIKIKLEFEEVREILGKIVTKQNQRNLNNKEILNCLKQLNFPLFEIEEKTCIVQIPLQRKDDLESKIDLIEEIGRIYGFNKFVSYLPESKQLGTVSKEEAIVSRLRPILINEGFNEIINYSFKPQKQDTEMQILNPLGLEFANLRTSLIPNLVETTQNNLKQRNPISWGFEFGRTFNKVLNVEYTMLSGIFGGVTYKSDWDYKNSQQTTLTWYEAKDKINKIGKSIGLNLNWAKVGTEMGGMYHPGRTAILSCNAKEIGFFSQLNPLYAKQNDLPCNIFLFELNLTKISILEQTKEKIYSAFSPFPKIRKDITFNVPIETSSQQFLKEFCDKISSIDNINLLKEVTIFDEYKNDKETTIKSLGIKLTFQSETETLQTSEVETVMNKISEKI
jgi:phenylalanyl-tRNA synthetase beta chain